MINHLLDLPEALERRIEDEATRQGREVIDFLTLLIGIFAIPAMRQSEDPIVRDLSDELMLYFQSQAADMERRSGKTLDMLPHLFTEDETQGDPTLALFAQWAAEDATDDPEEIARRELEDAETASQLRQNRFSLEGRTDFQRLTQGLGGEAAA